MSACLLTQFYGIMLRLYPRPFREEFGDEMQSVFTEAVSDASTSGLSFLFRTAVQEFVELTAEALRERMAQHPVGAIQSAGWQGLPSRKETLLALGVFLLPVLCLVYQAVPFAPSPWWVYTAIAVCAGLLLAGVARGFPRWSLPYLGLALSGASFYFLFQWGADMLSPAAIARMGVNPSDDSMRLLLQAAWAGMMWLGLFVITFLAIGLLTLLRRFQPLLERIRQDWTLASYILYSGGLAVITLAFVFHRYEKLNMAGATLFLAAGSWLYLRSPRAWQRSVALLSGLGFSVAALSGWQWPLIPLQAWPDPSNWLWPDSLDGFGIQGMILEWGWLAAIILAPALVKFLPRPGPGTAEPA